MLLLCKYFLIFRGVLEGLEVANKGPFFHLESLSGRIEIDFS
jgi:hypothetical protein